jgi:hypothetical protein
MQPDSVAMARQLDDDMQICATGDKLELTYRCSVDSSVPVSKSAIQAAFRKTMLDIVTQAVSPVTPAITTGNSTSSMRQDRRPRTKKGDILPDEIMGIILVFLKSDRQIQSLTSF